MCIFFLQQPELLKLNEERNRINAKIKSSRKELDKKIEEKRKHAVEMDELQKGIYDLTAELKDVTKRSLDEGGKLNLADDQLNEYFRM